MELAPTDLLQGGLFAGFAQLLESIERPRL